MYSIYDQINNRKVLVYPERTTADVKTTDSVVLTNEQIASTNFPEDIDVKPEIKFDKVEIGEGNFIYNGDNIQVLKTLPDNSVDSVVTDPPYGLKFMGKQWDYDVPSVELWKECFRVLKTGGYLLSFGSSRTYHRMVVKVEDAGFEIRDQLMWVYGTGFPKSHNVGKAVDKLLGNERLIIDEKEQTGAKFITWSDDENESRWFNQGFNKINGRKFEITKGESQFEGFGTGLKPAHEPIVLARKPISEKSVAKNVLKWNTGGLNIDKCRIEIGDERVPRLNVPYAHKSNNNFGGGNDHRFETTTMSQKENEGRFPANMIFDVEAGLILDQQSGITKSSKRSSKYNKKTEFTNTYTPIQSDYRDDNTYKDKGGASRFFYCPKPSKKEKDKGLTIESSIIKGRDEGQDSMNVPQKIRNTKRKNSHSTVKPVKLMQYLIRLVTPIGGSTIDPFFGSGTSGISVIKEKKFKFIGIEKEKEYFDISVERCQYEYQQSLKVAA